MSGCSTAAGRGEESRLALSDLLTDGRVLRYLAAPGAFDPRRLVAGAAVLPWLVGRGASLGWLCQVNAVAHPCRTAVIDRQGEQTWWQLEQRANRLATGLSGLGVRPGDQVAILLRNGREFVEALLATQKIGLVAAPMNTWGRSRDLAAILGRARPAALVYDTRQAAQLDGVVPEGTRLIHVGAEADPLPGSCSYESVLARGRVLPPVPVAFPRAAPRILIQTSGTTGTPKAAARSTGTEGGAALLGVLEAVPFRHDDVVYMANPMFHAFGILVFAIGMVTGATMVLPDAFDARRALEDMEREQATAATFVPVMLRRMLDLADPPAADLSRLRLVLASGSALPGELRERVRGRFGEVLHDLYGSTEAGWIAIATPAAMRAAPGTVGRPVTGVDLAILDPDGRSLPAGSHGEIHVRGAATFDGYTTNETVSERAGYLSTGDLGFLDAQGYLHVVGRADDMAVVGGENVHPDEIEAVIGELDGVRDVAVVGVADDELGQVLAAFVVGPVTAAQIIAACADILPSYKVPRHVTVVDELPRTSTGKVLRGELAASQP